MSCRRLPMPATIVIPLFRHPAQPPRPGGDTITERCGTARICGGTGGDCLADGADAGDFLFA